ncbi:MAG: hypothetical protein J6J52_00905 [Oscillospiraceae bacterium]|nr:hypothetical protein [Oscillospiraceae bacterium]
MEKELYKMREIKMPDEMKARILSRCEREVLKEEKFMKNKIRKPITLAVAIAVCISMSVAVVASVSEGGFFKDKKDTFEAVTGSVYLNATEEIEVSVIENKIDVTFLNPDIPPYNCSEILSVGEYIITNENGEEISYSGFEKQAVTDGKTSFGMTLDKGKYTLTIKSFVSEKKADQPLEIKGLWECKFEVN